jgi:hypothetical protein
MEGPRPPLTASPSFDRHVLICRRALARSQARRRHSPPVRKSLTLSMRSLPNDDCLTGPSAPLDRCASFPPAVASSRTISRCQTLLDRLLVRRTARDACPAAVTRETERGGAIAQSQRAKLNAPWRRRENAHPAAHSHFTKHLLPHMLRHVPVASARAVLDSASGLLRTRHPPLATPHVRESIVNI